VDLQYKQVGRQGEEDERRRGVDGGVAGAGGDGEETVLKDVVAKYKDGDGDGERGEAKRTCENSAEMATPLDSIRRGCFGPCMQSRQRLVDIQRS